MPTTQPAPRAGAIAALAAALVLTFAVALQLRVGGDRATTALANLGQLAAATGAAFACWHRSRTRTGRWRLSWLLLAGATGSWAFGQLLWTHAEVTTAELPFPSWADVGFLLFPLLGLAGLLVRPVLAFERRGRVCVLLDGVMVAASLFSLSWVTSLGQTYSAGADGTPAFLISLAYPVSDLILITVAVMVLAQASTRTGLVLLTGGLIAMAVADSAFLYLNLTGSYATGALVDVAWVAAFVLIGLSAGAAKEVQAQPMTGWLTSAYLCLPYAVVGVGVMSTLFEPPGDSDVVEYAALGAVGALMLRQLLALLDNRRLLDDVASQQGELRRRAFYDELTGLANRALFSERVEHALALHRRNERALSVLFCDLDDFKSVNDTLGHAAGDRLLAEVADRLLAMTRPGDTVARLGGDEFAVLLEDDADGGALAARMLDEVLRQPVTILDRAVPVRASIGVATLQATEPTIDSRELIRRADVAMYSAKSSGKGRAVPYVHVSGPSADHDLDLQLALARDIDGGGLRAALQPVYGVHGGLRGYEALARWRYAGQAVPPDVFIPVAERAGLLPRLDMAVLDQAITRIAEHQADTFVSVNIGIRHLADAAVVERVAEVMRRHSLPARRLVVEVPEDQAISDPAVMATLQGFREMGVRLAMDDFGVGFSCLSRIGEIRPDIIKLDRSFVTPLDDPDERTDILAGIIELAHRVGAVVIGEGVETQAQLDALIRLGCDGLQGYLLGRPEEIKGPAPNPGRLAAVTALHARTGRRAPRSA
jgi:diguanylate cyclase (GGDEF)-like protein